MRGEYDAQALSSQAALELPPRARRIPKPRCSNNTVHGTTSACAENTFLVTGSLGSIRNYLRVRGEYRQGAIASNFLLELPPRARRILLVPVTPVDDFGTTSACAENTNCSVVAVLLSRNYLRVRGEYCAFTSVEPHGKELPPRARRIRGHDAVVGVQHGTTSACAENTRVWPWPGRCPGNYLRVRGEYGHSATGSRASRELPPRARRIPHTRHSPGAAIGTTSACAENTLCSFFTSSNIWNYLRVRGEYTCLAMAWAVSRELPPRARRIRSQCHG